MHDPEVSEENPGLAGPRRRGIPPGARLPGRARAIGSSLRPSMGMVIYDDNTCVFQFMQNYCLFRNYYWRHFFLPPNRFCIFLMLHMFAGFETAKKTDETAKKTRAQNVETETAKKTGNSENLGNRQ